MTHVLQVLFLSVFILQVGKASKEYYIQFCQERVYREREVLLILKRDNLYNLWMIYTQCNNKV
jgi:hypothetical protein